MNGVYNLGDIVLGNWKLVRNIGEGSYGRVYEAEREEFHVTYKSAIKIITIPQSQSEITEARSEGMDEESVTAYFRGFVEELVQEFVLMSKLKGHSNIVSYEDHSVVPHENGVGWDIIIRMELLTPLMSYVRDRQLSREEIIHLGIDLCKALELCQKQNIIHRDIKPENIFMSEMGDFKLGDFGIARTAEKTSGVLSKKGTYTYMAPEVYKEEPYNASVDIYSLGIVLYRLLNENRAPFLPAYPQPITYSDREKALAQRMAGTELIRPVHADDALDQIIRKACSYHPEGRYQSPQDMRKDLEAAARGAVPEVEEDEPTVGVFAAAPAETIPDTHVTSDDKTECVFNSSAAASEEHLKDTQQQKTEAADDKKKPETAAAKKKSKLPLIGGVAVAAVAVVAVFAMMGGQSDQGDIPQTDPQGDGLAAVESAQPEGGKADTETFASMLWGSYTIDDYKKVENKDYYDTDLTNFVKGMKYTTIGDRDLSVVPYKIVDCGPFGRTGASVMPRNQEDWDELHEEFLAEYDEKYWENYTNILNADAIQFLYCDQVGNDWMPTGLYEVEGNILRVCFDVEFDEKTFEVTCPTWIEYQFEFRGRNLVLKYDDIEVEMVPTLFSSEYVVEEIGQYMNGYVQKDEDAYHGISDVYYSNDGDSTPFYSVGFTDGGHAEDPMIELSGDNTITISWEEAWRPYNGRNEKFPESVRLTAQYISCGNEGLILIDDGKYYLYQSSMEQYGEYKLADSLGDVAASDLTDSQRKDLIATQSSVLTDLDAAFTESGVEADINESTGVVTMDSSILFGFDDAALSEAGKGYLDGFFDVYSTVILDEKYSGAISEIRVEGHTDTDGEYDYNMTLSQARAQAVVDYCLGKNPELSDFIVSKGCASDDPVYNEDGSVNMEASRRVMFKFILSVES